MRRRAWCAAVAAAAAVGVVLLTSACACRVPRARVPRWVPTCARSSGCGVVTVARYNLHHSPG